MKEESNNTGLVEIDMHLLDHRVRGWVRQVRKYEKQLDMLLTSIEYPKIHEAGVSTSSYQ